MIRTQSIYLIALITAVCVMSDSMLYIVLPVYWPSFGLTNLWQVGVLLSINRFVRLPLNPLAGWLHAKFGLRRCLLAAVCISVATTLSYGLLRGFWLLAAARCLWGIAWAVLRLGGYLAVLEASGPDNRGRLMGSYNGLWGLGGLVGMLAGGIGTDYWGVQPAMLAIGALTLVGLLIAARYLPQAQGTGTAQSDMPPARERRRARPPWLNAQAVLTLLSGLVIASVFFGILPSTLTGIIEERPFQLSLFGVALGAASLSGILQGLRAGWSPFLSPWFGKLSDRPTGRKPWICASLIASTLLFVLLSMPSVSAWLWFGCLLGALLLNTAVTTWLDASAADCASEAPSARVPMMTSYTLVFDLGSALGPAIGYMVIDSFGVFRLYRTSGLLLFLLAIVWAVAWRAQTAKRRLSP
ncbi:MFS transporter [Cohnella lubricantis]|uniref:MFS transporter n=1 Tax=Cohnella lubricantis TaxID=2163172 RepID=A0A841TCE1_9BACL|nr:MFS transporter [Cohnella lubricantis]MBB6678682.1 MFS transporter [Cohnella lubricantis]MBP2118568.1 MFS family permease [Cohnella lubricantis]